jgi:hypothetical protein
MESRHLFYFSPKTDGIPIGDTPVSILAYKVFTNHPLLALITEALWRARRPKKA